MNEEQDLCERRKELLKEYELLINLYMHEDNLQFKITEISILINSGLATIAIYGPQRSEFAIFISFLGIVVCYGWKAVSYSCKIHHDLRIRRARQIEADLGNPGTFHDEANIFFHRQSVKFHYLHEPNGYEEFPAVKRGFKLAQDIIENLSILVGMAWIIFFIIFLTRILNK